MNALIQPGDTLQLPEVFACCKAIACILSLFHLSKFCPLFRIQFRFHSFAKTFLKPTLPFYFLEYLLVFIVFPHSLWQLIVHLPCFVDRCVNIEWGFLEARDVFYPSFCIPLSTWDSTLHTLGTQWILREFLSSFLRLCSQSVHVSRTVFSR